MVAALALIAAVVWLALEFPPGSKDHDEHYAIAMEGFAALVHVVVGLGVASFCGLALAIASVVRRERRTLAWASLVWHAAVMLVIVSALVRNLEF